MTQQFVLVLVVVATVTATAWAIARSAIEKARREIGEAERRQYDARLTQLLDLLGRYPTVNVIRDATGTTLQGRELEGPLVFIGGERNSIIGCNFREAAQAATL